jgi:hypothetical protein
MRSELGGFWKWFADAVKAESDLEVAPRLESDILLSWNKQCGTFYKSNRLSQATSLSLGLTFGFSGFGAMACEN